MVMVIAGNGSITGASSLIGNLSITGTANVSQGLTTVSRGISNASVPAGSIIQVQQAYITSTFSTTSTSYTDITGLSVSITPTSTSSKILIMSCLTRGASLGALTQFRLARGGSGIFVGDASGSRPQSSSACYVGSNDLGYHVTSVDIKYVDSPATTSSTTYSVQCRCQGGETTYVGRNATDPDSVSGTRAASSIIVMEIAQ